MLSYQLSYSLYKLCFDVNLYIHLFYVDSFLIHFTMVTYINVKIFRTISHEYNNKWWSLIKQACYVCDSLFFNFVNEISHQRFENVNCKKFKEFYCVRLLFIGVLCIVYSPSWKCEMGVTII